MTSAPHSPGQYAYVSSFRPSVAIGLLLSSFCYFRLSPLLIAKTIVNDTTRDNGDEDRNFPDDPEVAAMDDFLEVLPIPRGLDDAVLPIGTAANYGGWE